MDCCEGKAREDGGRNETDETRTTEVVRCKLQKLRLHDETCSKGFEENYQICTKRCSGGGGGFWVSPVFEESCIVHLAAKFWRKNKVGVPERGIGRHNVLRGIP